MFGVQRLKDEIEGLQEERNYFRSKFLEQVSEIASLKEALKQSEREVSRLRREVMAVASPELLRSRQKVDEEKKEDTDTMMHVMSSLSVDDDDDSDDEDEDEQAAIRMKAEQLVRWASYRQEVLSPERSSVAVEDDNNEEEEDDDEKDSAEHDDEHENDDKHEHGDEKPFDQEHDEKARVDTEHETDEEEE